MLHRTMSAAVVVATAGGCANAEPVPPTPFADLRINEVAAAGDPLDWVELVTIGAVDIDIDGLFITDDEADPGKAALPAVVVAPGEFVVVEIDEFGLGFRIGSDEALFVIDPAGEAIDGTDWDEGASPDGGSWGRSSDGTGDFVTFTTATRGTSNG